MMIVRIFALSLLAAGMAAWIAFAVLGNSPDAGGFCILIGCAGGIIGAIAGAALEIVTALGPREPSDNHGEDNSSTPK